MCLFTRYNWSISMFLICNPITRHNSSFFNIVVVINQRYVTLLLITWKWCSLWTKTAGVSWLWNKLGERIGKIIVRCENMVDQRSIIIVRILSKSKRYQHWSLLYDWKSSKTLKFVRTENFHKENLKLISKNIKQ